MQSSKDETSRSAWIGWLALAGLILVVAVWFYSSLLPRQSQEELGRSSSLAASSEDLSAFRSAAWFLPDEALLGFVEIPAGPFVMGSDSAVDSLAFNNERWSETRAQGTVDLPAFFIGRYEVTVGQFKAFADATGHKTDDQALRAPPNHPVTMISWPDALAYSRWLETKLREWPETPSRLSQLLRDGGHVNLPTEAQWEKAARGMDGRIYPWGSAARPDRANYNGTGTMSVGSFTCPECPFGLFDMSGNVWEWTRSPYQPYPYDPIDDRKNLEADALWVMRGGSFGDTELNIRTAIRGGADPGARRAFIGFRVVISRL
jgi:formylglycine-generating enzyme required for sulfatase activity